MVSDLLNKALRARYVQFGRIVRLDTPLGEDALVPLYVRGRACLGRDFEFTIDATSTRVEPIQAKALIRQAVTLWIRQTDGSEMPIHGYVMAFVRLGEDGANTYYQFRFNSFLALLRLGSDRRDWIETPAQQTVSDVLGKYPQASGNVAWQLRRALRSYSQRMQWESDWNYVHRTFEELGLFPRFDIARDGKSHKVVVMDDLFSVPALKSGTISFSRSVQDEEFDGLSEWIIEQDSWFVEGAYDKRMYPLLAECSLILRVEVPFGVRAVRLIKRFVQSTMTGKLPRETFLNTVDLIKFSYRFDKRLSEFLSRDAALSRKVVSVYDTSSCIEAIGVADLG